jgi:serine/threonine-protein kinase RIO1
MSNETDLKESNVYDINWLEKSIEEEHVKYYEYSDFKNFQSIESGSSGNVIRAYGKNNRFYALKSFNNKSTTFKEIVNEVKYLRLFKKFNLKNKLLLILLYIVHLYYS